MTVDLPYPPDRPIKKRKDGQVFFHARFPHIVVATTSATKLDVHWWLTANLGIKGYLYWSFTRGWYIAPNHARWALRDGNAFFLEDENTAILLKLTFDVSLKAPDDPEWRIWPD